MNIYYQNFRLFLYQTHDFGVKNPLSFSETGSDVPLTTPFEVVFESIDVLLRLMKTAQYGTLSLPFDSADGQKAFFKELRQHFDYDIAAAGGVVVQPKDYFAPLLMKRRGVWDLPKGKVEAWERNEVAAEREIKEETGLQHLRLVQPLTETYHFYRYKDAWYFKTTYWYLFEADPPYTLHPQAEEDITELRWEKMTATDVQDLYTFENVREVLKTYWFMGEGGHRGI